MRPLSLPKEQWRDVPGFVGKYQLSNAGRLYRIGYGLVIPGTWKRCQYQRLAAVDANGIKRYLKIHRLVYMLFAGPIPDGMTINHKNGHTTDNRIENLELMTVAENSSHAATVLNRVGKLRPTEVTELRKLKKQMSYSRVAARFGVSRRTAIRACKRQTYWYVDSHPQSSVENHGSDRGRDVKPLAGGNESADSPLAGDEKVSLSSPAGVPAPSGASVSMQPADGTAASTGAQGSAPLKLVGQSMPVSGNGSHAVERSPSSRERDKR